MTYWQETKGARALREQTNDALDAHDIAPTPENYELLFHYTLAHDLDLKSALKEAFAVERGAMLELLDQIHTKFFRSSSGENLNQSEQEFEAQLRQFSEVLAAADRGSLTFGNTLDLAAAQMSRAGAPDHLHSLLQSLASATRLMSEQNRELKAQVQETSGEVAALRSKMDVIRQEALVDALTGLANRRAFDRTLALAVQYARSESTPLCVLMCDIDHFKKFNDTWGHATGDQVLKLVAHCVGSNVKGRDTAARYGGEELVVILPTTYLADSMIVAEQIRRTVATRKIIKKSTGESYGSITLSIGVSELKSGESAEEFLARADQCLYAAKHAGRNRVCSVSPSSTDVSGAKVRKPGNDSALVASIMELEFPDGGTAICVDPEVTLRDLRLNQLHQWWKLKCSEGLPVWRADYLNHVSFVRDAYHLYELTDQGARICLREMSPTLASLVGEDAVGRWIDIPVASREKLTPTLARAIEIVRLAIQMKSAIRSFSKDAHQLGLTWYRDESVGLPFTDAAGEVRFVLAASIMSPVDEEEMPGSLQVLPDRRAS